MWENVKVKLFLPNPTRHCYKTIHRVTSEDSVFLKSALRVLMASHGKASMQSA